MFIPPPISQTASIIAASRSTDGTKTGTVEQELHSPPAPVSPVSTQLNGGPVADGGFVIRRNPDAPVAGKQPKSC